MYTAQTALRLHTLTYKGVSFPTEVQHYTYMNKCICTYTCTCRYSQCTNGLLMHMTIPGADYWATVYVLWSCHWVTCMHGSTLPWSHTDKDPCTPLLCCYVKSSRLYLQESQICPSITHTCRTQSTFATYSCTCTYSSTVLACGMRKCTHSNVHTGVKYCKFMYMDW